MGKVEQALHSEYAGAAVMRCGKRRVERDGGIETGEGFPVSIRGQERHAATFVRLRIVGIERNGLFEAGQSVLMLLEGAQHHAMVMVRIIVLWIDLERPTDEIFGLFQIAALKVQNAQEVVGVKQIAPCCDKLTIKVLGTTDITGLMRRKGFRNSSHFIDADLRGSHRSRFECEALRKCDGDHRTSGRGAQRVDVVLHSQISPRSATEPAGL
jgi:hypothetical protein